MILKVRLVLALFLLYWIALILIFGLKMKNERKVYANEEKTNPFWSLLNLLNERLKHIEWIPEKSRQCNRHRHTKMFSSRIKIEEFNSYNFELPFTEIAHCTFTYGISFVYRVKIIWIQPMHWTWPLATRYYCM